MCAAWLNSTALQSSPHFCATQSAAANFLCATSASTSSADRFSTNASGTALAPHRAQVCLDVSQPRGAPRAVQQPTPRNHAEKPRQGAALLACHRRHALPRALAHHHVHAPRRLVAVCRHGQHRVQRGAQHRSGVAPHAHHHHPLSTHTASSTTTLPRPNTPNALVAAGTTGQHCQQAHPTHPTTNHTHHQKSNVCTLAQHHHHATPVVCSTIITTCEHSGVWQRGFW